MKVYDAILHMRVPADVKVRWEKAAKRAKVKLSAFVRDAVDKAAR